MTPESLLKTLTLDQKLAQFVGLGLGRLVTTDGKFDPQKANEQYPHGVFGVSIPIDMPPAEIGLWVRNLREFFAKTSPVPPIIFCESLHGIMGVGTTVFPQSIGLGSSFDSSLVERIGEAIGKEAKAMGIRMSLTPDLDLGRDPRWGRIEEAYGEAPLLVGEMGEAYVKGLLADDGKYLATVKHFVAHGSPEAGLNHAPVNISDQELEDKYLPPFKRVIDAGAKGVMPAYSALNGVPCHANPKIMNTILRERWGFDGVVVSDFAGIRFLSTTHRCVEDLAEAALRAFKVGVDVETPETLGYKHLKELVEEGKITVEEVDKVVLRILKLKEDLGLYDLPMPDIEEIKKIVNCDEHKALAKEAAHKSIVLMKNNGALPLKEGKKIAVIGPNAFRGELGAYSIVNLNVKSPVQAITERAEKAGGSVISAKGCDVYGSDKSGFAEAEAAANDADAVVLMIGGRSMKNFGVGWGFEDNVVITCGEGCDTHDLTPGGPQLELARKIIATGKPVTIVMIDGRPETLFDVGENCDALVVAWYPGEEGSDALADLLFGDVNFSAKLPVTFPKHVGQLPVYHDRVNSACGYYHSPGTPENPGRDYVFLDPLPAFEFGYGIGYSELVYSNLKAEAINSGIRICVQLENKGKYDADEPVLVFIRDEIASFPQPIKKLAAIKTTKVAAGQTINIEIDVPKEELMFTDINMQKRLEKGWFTVMVGGLDTRLYIEA